MTLARVRDTGLRVRSVCDAIGTGRRGIVEDSAGRGTRGDRRSSRYSTVPDIRPRTPRRNIGPARNSPTDGTSSDILQSKNQSQWIRRPHCAALPGLVELLQKRLASNDSSALDA